MSEQRASRTAVLVCQGRAVADGLIAVDHFRDPIASRMLTASERAAVARARDATPPSGAPERMAWERLRACADGMVPRTVLIDDVVRDTGHGQLVIVGAGLDFRPWRMTELADVDVFCVDQPASQADARQRSEDIDVVARRMALVPVSLGSEPLGAALAVSGHDAGQPTTWIWEGVVPYLTEDEIDATLTEIAERSAPGSVLVVQYQVPWVLARLGRRASAFVAKRSGLDDPMADEPWRSTWTPPRMAEVLGRHGFRVEQDEDLLATAARIGSPTRRRRSLANGRVAVATTTR